MLAMPKRPRRPNIRDSEIYGLSIPAARQDRIAEHSPIEQRQLGIHACSVCSGRDLRSAREHP